MDISEVTRKSNNPDRNHFYLQDITEQPDNFNHELNQPESNFRLFDLYEEET